MLTAVILAYDAPDRPLRPDAVARGLASLVDSCVRGLVADAVLVAAPERGLGAIADEAGCVLIETSQAEAGLKEALKIARQDAILALRAGHVVERGFTDEVSDIFAYGDRKRPLILRAAPHNFLTRLAPRLAPAVGVIAPKEIVTRHASPDIARIARRLGGVDLATHARRIV